MGQHPDVLAAMHDALARCGVVAGGTPNVSVTAHDQMFLEAALADPHRKEAALLFTSGYVSNWTSLGALEAMVLVGAILKDALNHASTIEHFRQLRAES